MREAEDRFGCPLIELWGMTELGGLGTTFPAYGPYKHDSIGVPLPYVQCRIADVDNAGRTAPMNEVGELMVRGPIVMQGYFGNEEMTRETIEPDGWLHTGDLARMDEDRLHLHRRSEEGHDPHRRLQRVPRRDRTSGPVIQPLPLSLSATSTTR